MSTVLITGVQGFVGGHLASALLRAGHKVLGISQKQRLCWLDHENLRGQLVWRELALSSVSELGQLMQQYKVDFVFHLAAVATQQASAHVPELTVRANIMGTTHVLEACRHYGNLQGIFLAQSHLSYGPVTKDQAPFKEQDRKEALAFYAATKSASIMMARSYVHTFKMPILNGYFANIYGPGDLNPGRLITRSCLRLATQQAPLLYQSASHQSLDLIYIDDVIAVLLNLLKTPKLFYEEQLNIGSGRLIAIREVLSQLCELAEFRPGYEILPDGQASERNSERMAIDRLNQLMPERTGTELAQGLQHSYAWYQQHASQFFQALF